jgi:hypothetical protein
MLTNLVVDVSQVISQIATGRLLSADQIRTITGNVVGRYFADWFATPKDEQDAARRVDAAKDHLAEATRLILSLKTDLDEQAKKLDAVVADLQVKKTEASHYETLAATNKALYEPLKRELRESLRRELEEQAAKGRRLRQVVAIVGWVITLILGAYVPQIVAWLRALAV